MARRTVAVLALAGIALASQTSSGQIVGVGVRPPTPARQDYVQKTGTGVIRGRIVADVGERPLASTRVTATMGAAVVEPVFTDGSGRFEITGLAVGRYTLAAEKAGYARTRFGARDELDPAVPIDVLANGDVPDVEIRLPKGAAIFGRIVDDLGDPIAGANVSVGSFQLVGRAPRLVNVSRPPSETNDLGEYRIGGLSAGRYFVSVSQSSQAFVPGVGPVGRFPGWAASFYPGTPSLAAAQPILVASGEERGGIDFLLTPVEPATLSIVLDDGSDLTLEVLTAPSQSVAAAGSSVASTDRATAPAIMWDRAGPPRMRAKTLAPGDWWVLARGARGTSLAHVSLASGETATVDLSLNGHSRISGRVAFEGVAPAPTFANVRIRGEFAGVEALKPIGAAFGRVFLGQPAVVKPDGTFEIVGALSTVTLQTVNPLPGWTLRAIMLHGRDLLEEPLELKGGEQIADVEMIFTDQIVELSGYTVDASGGAIAGCTVAVFPDGRERSPSFRTTRLERADQKGRFKLENLPAGSYLAAAVPRLDAALWMTTDSLDRLRQIGVRVTWAERQKKETTLPCLSVQ